MSDFRARPKHRKAQNRTSGQKRMAFSTRRRHGGAQEDQAVTVADESSKKNRAENRRTLLTIAFLCVTLVSIFGLHLLVSRGAQKDTAVSAPSAAEGDKAPTAQIGQQQLQSVIDTAQPPEVKPLPPPAPAVLEAAGAVLLSEGRPATASVLGNLAAPDAITSEKVRPLPARQIPRCLPFNPPSNSYCLSILPWLPPTILSPSWFP